MPLTNDKLPERESFEVLEDGTYQVVISDINDYEGKNFNTGEPEAQYVFDLDVLDEGHEGHKLKVWTTKKYGAAKQGRKESKLYTIITKAMKKIVPANEVSLSGLIGKQLIVVVTKYQNDDGYDRNKVVTFMEVKKELPLPENIKTFIDAGQVMNGPEKSPSQKVKDGETSTEQINLEDIPF